MGDRFYMAQKDYKPSSHKKADGTRKLKADFITDLQVLIDAPISGLDKLTVNTITELTQAIQERIDQA